MGGGSVRGGVVGGLVRGGVGGGSVRGISKVSKGWGWEGGQ